MTFISEQIELCPSGVWVVYFLQGVALQDKLNKFLLATILFIPSKTHDTVCLFPEGSKTLMITMASLEGGIQEVTWWKKLRNEHFFNK